MINLFYIHGLKLVFFSTLSSYVLCLPFPTFLKYQGVKEHHSLTHVAYCKYNVNL